MNRFRIFLTAFAVFLTFSLTGCTTTQIETPTSQIYNSDELSINEIKNSIILACEGRDWRVDNVTSSYVTAVYSKPGMSATVQINYDATKYTIEWKNSTGSLERKGDTIHKTYNRWVRNLQLDIDKKLNAIKSRKFLTE
jgi:hypothetical protein